MGFQNSRLSEIVADVNRGKIVRIYFKSGRQKRPLRAVKPGMKFQFTGELAGGFKTRAQYLQARKSITVAALPTADQTFSIAAVDANYEAVSKTFTFKAAAAADLEITIGVDEDATAVNIAAKINSNFAGVLTATSATDTVTITATIPGEAFTITEALAGLTTATLGAIQTLTLSGTPIARTTAQIILRGLTVNGAVQDVYCQYDIQSGDTTTTVATALVAILEAAQDDSTIPANSRYFSTNPDDTEAQIAAGIQASYGLSGATPTPFTSSTNVITLIALSTLAEGEKLDIATENAPGASSEPNLDNNGVPQEAGIKNWGYTTDLVVDFSGSRSDINADQKLQPIAKSVTGTTANVSFNMLCDENSDLLRQGSGFGAIAHTNDREQFLPNYYDSPEEFTLFIVTADPRFDGEFLVITCLNCSAAGFQLGRQLRANVPIPVALSIDAEQGDEVVIASRFRPAAVAA